MAKKMSPSTALRLIDDAVRKHRGYEDEWFVSDIAKEPYIQRSPKLREAVAALSHLQYPLGTPPKSAKKEAMATKRSTKRVKRSVKRPANRALSSISKGARSANLSPKRGAKKAAKKTTALAKRSGSSRELMSRKQTPWTNALGEVRKKTPSKPGDATYTNKVEFICRNPETGDEKTVYHKARAKSCADKGWEVLARPRPRPETNPKSKKYAGRRARA